MGWDTLASIFLTTLSVLCFYFLCAWEISDPKNHLLLNHIYRDNYILNKEIIRQNKKIIPIKSIYANQLSGFNLKKSKL